MKPITKGIYARFRENVLISYLFTPLRGILNSETGKESIESSLPTENSTLLKKGRKKMGERLIKWTPHL